MGYYYSVQESSLAPVKLDLAQGSSYSCHKEICSGFESALR